MYIRHIMYQISKNSPPSLTCTKYQSSVARWLSYRSDFAVNSWELTNYLRGRGRLVRGFNELFYEIKCSILVEIDIIFYFHSNCAWKGSRGCRGVCKKVVQTGSTNGKYIQAGVVVSYTHKTKESWDIRFLSRLLKMAATYSPTYAVPSARLSLTTLFGMGRGGTSAL